MWFFSAIALNWYKNLIGLNLDIFPWKETKWIQICGTSMARSRASSSSSWILVIGHSVTVCFPNGNSLMVSGDAFGFLLSRKHLWCIHFDQFSVSCSLQYSVFVIGMKKSLQGVQLPLRHLTFSILFGLISGREILSEPFRRSILKARNRNVYLPALR